MPLSSDVDLQQIASKTSGFVGSDIRFLCREAAYRAIRRAFSDRKLSEIETSRIEGLTVSHIDFEEALKTVTPSAIREFTVDIPITRWEDIGGLTDTKQLLIDNVVNGFKNREYFSEHNIPLVRGVLLYGQPGTGKTLIGKAIAYECGAQFLPIKGPALRSRWFGESEEKIRDLFSKAKEAAPCIIFFDEIDAVAPSRLRNQNALTDSLVNQLLSEMDGLTTTRDVVVIGATNRPELLDPALLRPGRFDYQIEIPLPDLRGRESIFSIHLNQKDLAPDVDLDLLVRDTEGMSGADISEICREAMWEAAKVGGYKNEHLTITMQNLLRGLENVKKSLTRYKVELSYIG